MRVRACVRACARVCVWGYVCITARLCTSGCVTEVRKVIYIYICIYIYIYIYITQAISVTIYTILITALSLERT